MKEERRTEKPAPKKKKGALRKFFLSADSRGWNVQHRGEGGKPRLKVLKRGKGECIWSP